jgi:hypothetical protein
MKSSLTLCIKDFENIKEAEIDIAPMMLFIGHNNTGKSYVAMLWFGIIYILQEFNIFDDKFKMSTNYKYVREWLDKQEQGFIEPYPELLTHFISVLNEFLETRKIELVSYVFNSTEVSIGEIKLQLNLFDNLSKLEWKIDDNLSPNEIKLEKNSFSSCRKQNIQDMFLVYKTILDMFIGAIIGYGRAGYGRQVSYLPASRSGYMVAYKALTAEAHKRAWSLRNNSTFFTQPIALFLRDLVIAEFRISRYNDLCDFLEEQVLDGKIVEIKQPTLNEYLFQPKGIDALLPFHVTSSLVSELAPLIIFLRSHKIYSLIMEEPEAHLHPQAQRTLMRTLARLFNRNVPILLTTHSTTIFQQVNNLITLFNHPKQTEMLEKFGYSKDELLNPDDVIAYQFEETPEGTKISKLEKTETGFIAPTFNKTIAEFSKESFKIREVEVEEEDNL